MHSGEHSQPMKMTPMHEMPAEARTHELGPGRPHELGSESAPEI